jgi:hypothetical protein
MSPVFPIPEPIRILTGDENRLSTSGQPAAPAAHEQSGGLDGERLGFNDNRTASRHRASQTRWASAERAIMTSEANTIDEVITRLTEIIDWSREKKSRLGYFAALYRKVTIKVKEGIANESFDDGERMERLDVIFANRYLDAFESHRNDERPTRSWDYAFRVSRQWWPIVLQHLLLGMNAHINLDLGIAAARTVPSNELQDLRDDFNRINTILAGLVGEVQNELAQIWLLLRFMNRYLGSVEKAIINFSMEKARDHAWSTAERLSPLSEDAQAREIAKLDGDVAEFARVIRHPGILGNAVNRLIRVGERGSIAGKIGVLE